MAHNHVKSIKLTRGRPQAQATDEQSIITEITIEPVVYNNVRSPF